MSFIENTCTLVLSLERPACVFPFVKKVEDVTVEAVICGGGITGLRTRRCKATKRPAYGPEHSSYYLQLVNPADSPITR
jgi:hypothetical protein